MIKYILMDLDGTIIDSAPGITRSISYALAVKGYPEASPEVLRKCIGPPLTGSFRNLFGVPEEEVPEMIKTFRKRYNAQGMYECSLFDGIEHCLDSLKNMGYHISLASSKNEWACRQILDHLKITDRFEEIVGATENSSIETKKDVIEEFFKRMPNADPRETILVGDTRFDAEGAALAGIECVGVTYGYGNPEELRENGAKVLVASPKELEVYFESIKN